MAEIIIKEGEGYQSIHWQNFYEGTWEYRANFMRECLKKGYTSYQAIKQMQKMERKYKLLKNMDKIEWEPLFSKTVPFSPAGTPYMRKKFHFGAVSGYSLL